MRDNIAGGSMIEGSNMTHAEYFYLNGKLSEQRTEQLLSALHDAQAFDVREYASYAQEAQSGFPEEDFLAEHTSDLHHFAKRLRGENKKELLAIIERLIQTESDVAQSGEYGYDQLRKIICTGK
jgi:hypothetical protein